MALPDLEASVAFASDPGAATPTWTVLGTGVLKEFATKRGRANEKAETETGVMSWELRNQDRIFDPEFATSPYYGNLNPVKQARLRATYAAVTYDLFRGDVEDWPQAWEGRENNVSIDILDAFDFLDDVDISIDRGIELTGTRINAILDAAGWPAGMRSIDAGQSLVSVLTDLTGGDYRGALSMLKETKDSEYGNIFIDGRGYFIFHDRHRRLKSPYTTSQVTLANVPAGGEFPFSKVQPKRAKSDIINVAQITSGGITYVAQDTTSQTKYRKRSYAKTVLLTNTNEPPNMAAYIVSSYKDPISTWDYVVLEPQLDDGLWAHALGREIGDRVTIKATPPGGGSIYNIQGIIEKIEHRYVVGRWTTTWRLGRADTASYWVLGTSLLGTETRLAY